MGNEAKRGHLHCPFLPRRRDGLRSIGKSFRIDAAEPLDVLSADDNADEGLTSRCFERIQACAPPATGCDSFSDCFAGASVAPLDHLCEHADGQPEVGLVPVVALVENVSFYRTYVGVEIEEQARIVLISLFT